MSTATHRAELIDTCRDHAARLRVPMARRRATRTPPILHHDGIGYALAARALSRVKGADPRGHTAAIALTLVGLRAQRMVSHWSHAFDAADTTAAVVHAGRQLTRWQDVVRAIRHAVRAWDVLTAGT